MNAPRRRLNSKGFTLVELMVSVAIIAVIGPIIAQLFIKVTEGMAADEMHSQIQKLNELTMLRLHERLATSKRFFQNDVDGVIFLARARAGMSASAPAVLTNSLLPTSQTLTSTGTFSPGSSDSTAFGNSIFFGAYDTPATINGKAYSAPLTVKSNGTSSVVYQTGEAATMLIDVYRFYYYYLTPSNSFPSSTGGPVPLYRLVEWRSAQYADAAEINSISDGTLRQDVIKWLTTAGNASPSNPTYSITLAWDHSQDPNNAFYTLAGSTATLVPAANLVESDWSYITHISGGMLSGGFVYGICSNTATWADAPAKVPVYAQANSPFPGGFEVGMSGLTAGAEVMVRSFLVAHGYAPRVIYSDITTVSSIRDVW